MQSLVALKQLLQSVSNRKVWNTSHVTHGYITVSFEGQSIRLHVPVHLQLLYMFFFYNIECSMLQACVLSVMRVRVR
jgi:hypothetical protein